MRVRRLPHETTSSLKLAARIKPSVTSRGPAEHGRSKTASGRVRGSQGDIGVGALQRRGFGDSARQFLACLAGLDDGVDDPEVESTLQASGGGLVLGGQLRLSLVQLLRRYRSE